MTRPTFRVAKLAIEGSAGSSGFKHNWSNQNTVDGSSVPQPEFIEVEEPGAAQSGQRLPATARTDAVIFAFDTDELTVSYQDITRNSRDFDATVRFEVVVADDMHGRTGSEMLDDVLVVLEKIREANDTPTGGVFGSEWQLMSLVTIDKTPTDYSNHWRAFYDIGFEGQGVV